MPARSYIHKYPREFPRMVVVIASEIFYPDHWSFASSQSIIMHSTSLKSEYGYRNRLALVTGSKWSDTEEAKHVCDYAGHAESVHTPNRSKFIILPPKPVQPIFAALPRLEITQQPYATILSSDSRSQDPIIEIPWADPLLFSMR